MIDWLTMIDWWVDWLIDWMIDRLIDGLVDGLIGWLTIDWLIDWLIEYLIDWLTDWWTGWLTDDRRMWIQRFSNIFLISLMTPELPDVNSTHTTRARDTNAVQLTFAALDACSVIRQLHRILTSMDVGGKTFCLYRDSLHRALLWRRMVGSMIWSGAGSWCG